MSADAEALRLLLAFLRKEEWSLADAFPEALEGLRAWREASLGMREELIPFLRRLFARLPLEARVAVVRTWALQRDARLLEAEGVEFVEAAVALAPLGLPREWPCRMVWRVGRYAGQKAQVTVRVGHFNNFILSARPDAECGLTEANMMRSGVMVVPVDAWRLVWSLTHAGPLAPAGTGRAQLREALTKVKERFWELAATDKVGGLERPPARGKLSAEQLQVLSIMFRGVVPDRELHDLSGSRTLIPVRRLVAAYALEGQFSRWDQRKLTDYLEAWLFPRSR
jgi:hypothetical protein